MTVPIQKQIEILERVKNGLCGGSKLDDFWAYETMAKEGLIGLAPDWGNNLYQAHSTAKGMRRLQELTKDENQIEMEL